MFAQNTSFKGKLMTAGSVNDPKESPPCRDHDQHEGAKHHYQNASARGSKGSGTSEVFG